MLQIDNIPQDSTRLLTVHYTVQMLRSSGITSTQSKHKEPAGTQYKWKFSAGALSKSCLLLPLYSAESGSPTILHGSPTLDSVEETPPSELNPNWLVRTLLQPFPRLPDSNVSFPRYSRKMLYSDTQLCLTWHSGSLITSFEMVYINPSVIIMGGI